MSPRRLVHITILTLVLISGALTAAQEPPPVPTPDLGAVAAYFDEQERLFDFADYNVVFIAAPDADTEVFLVDGVTIQDLLSAHVYPSWQSFVAESAGGEPVEFLVIHGSVADQVDTEWTRAAFRNGTFILGLSMPFERYAEIVGDSCTKDPNPGIDKYFPDRYLLITFWAYSSQPGGKEAIQAGVLDRCDEKFDISAGRFIHGVAHLGITNPDMMEYAISSLRRFAVHKIADVGTILSTSTDSSR